MTNRLGLNVDRRRDEGRVVRQLPPLPARIKDPKKTGMGCADDVCQHINKNVESFVHCIHAVTIRYDFEYR